MAIKFSKSLQQRAASSSNTSFDLTFTQGKTYDLDQISNSRNRNATGTELLIGIKYDKDIAPIIWERLNHDITSSLKTNIDTDHVRDKINEIINKFFCETGDTYKTISGSNYDELNRRIDKALQEYSNINGIKFSISFNDSKSAEVSWDYRSDDYFAEKFDDYYKKYADLYENEISNVDEGALSLSDIRKKTPTSSLDYKSYLLNCGKTPYGNQIKAPQFTGRRPVIIVREGTEDNKNTQDNQETIYDTINQLTDTISQYEETLRQYKAILDDYQSKLNADIVNEIADDTPDGYLVSAKAVKDYINKKLKEYTPKIPTSYDSTNHILSVDFTTESIGNNKYILSTDQLVVANQEE